MNITGAIAHRLISMLTAEKDGDKLANKDLPPLLQGPGADDLAPGVCQGQGNAAAHGFIVLQ